MKTAFEKLMHNVEVVDGCWIKKSRKVLHDGERWAASRFSWLIFVGDIPTGFNVCHHCDLSHCINPACLFLGTQSDNILDAVSKGRFLQAGRAFRENPPVGEKHWKAKVTAKEIRRMRRDKRPPIEIAKDYGLSWGQVHKILRRECWSHI